MSKQQVVSKGRVSKHGEVYTDTHEVNAMLNLVRREANSIDSKFLEPACGNGNFLVEILRRKISTVIKENKEIQSDFERDVAVAVGSIYGIDIIPDNITQARARLFDIFDEAYTRLYGSCTTEEFRTGINFIIRNNIILGDALTQEAHVGSGELDCPISFYDWQIVNINNTMFNPEEYKIYLFSDLLLEQSKPFFDVVVGNPPYQMNDNGHGRSARPLYHLFVQQAKALSPKCISMIIPSRWFSGGKGLDVFRNDMLSDDRITEIHDFPDASNIFHSVKINGGVCYFLWYRDKRGLCDVFSYSKDRALLSVKSRPLLENNLNTFIRFNGGVSILKKVLATHEKSLMDQISPRKPYGLPTTYRGNTAQVHGSVKVYQRSGCGYIMREDIPKGIESVGKYKVFISPVGTGSGAIPSIVLGKPFVVGPNSICTETYLIAGKFNNKTHASNMAVYLKSKFVRFLVLLNKPSQHTTAKVYKFVPAQDFSQPCTDKELYTKYGLSKNEIATIESMIKPMV